MTDHTEKTTVHHYSSPSQYPYPGPNRMPGMPRKNNSTNILLIVLIAAAVVIIALLLYFIFVVNGNGGTAKNTAEEHGKNVVFQKDKIEVEEKQTMTLSESKSATTDEAPLAASSSYLTNGDYVLYGSIYKGKSNANVRFEFSIVNGSITNGYYYNLKADDGACFVYLSKSGNTISGYGTDNMGEYFKFNFTAHSPNSFSGKLYFRGTIPMNLTLSR